MCRHSTRLHVVCSWGRSPALTKGIPGNLSSVVGWSCDRGKWYFYTFSVVGYPKIFGPFLGEMELMGQLKSGLVSTWKGLSGPDPG